MRRKKHRVEETRTEIRVEEYVKAIHKFADEIEREKTKKSQFCVIAGFTKDATKEPIKVKCLNMRYCNKLFTAHVIKTALQDDPVALFSILFGSGVISDSNKPKKPDKAVN